MEHCRRRENQLGQCYPGEEWWGWGSGNMPQLLGLRRWRILGLEKRKYLVKSGSKSWTLNDSRFSRLLQVTRMRAPKRDYGIELA